MVIMPLAVIKLWLFYCDQTAQISYRFGLDLIFYSYAPLNEIPDETFTQRGRTMHVTRMFPGTTFGILSH